MVDARSRHAFLLVIVVAVTVAFLAVLRPFATTILLAVVFSGLAYPLYTRLERACKGRRALASTLTLLLVVGLVIVPLFLILGIVVGQAVRVTGRVTPLIQQLLDEPSLLDSRLQGIPGYTALAPFREQVLTRTADIAHNLATVIVRWLSSGTVSTVNFVFQFFLMLYTMFFLLMDGPRWWRAVLRHLPLNDRDQDLMTKRFLLVTRATVRGTLIIAMVQGALSGLAFAVVGINNALFWGVVMAVLSILPVVGGAMIWVPACIVLLMTGHPIRALSLAAFCSLVVGSVDNLLRPRLVGHDTRMPDVVVLFSTLGGLAVLGASGFIIGPVIAGLFITSWQILTASREQANPIIADTDRML